MSDKIKKNVLVVDDEIQWHDVFKRRFSLCSDDPDCPYKFHVDTASSLEESITMIRRLAQHFGDYDVVIFDLRMKREEAGLEGVRALALETRMSQGVFILFTGYPTYATCVEVMRNGAWDYVVKEDVSEQPAAQIVVDSAVTRLRALDLRRALERAVAEWFPHQPADLVRKHAGQVVALWHQPEIHVVASGDDAFELHEKLVSWRAQRQKWEEPFILRVPSEAKGAETET